MLILPLNPDLRVGYRPVITIGIAVLCILIHVFHVESQHNIEHAAHRYCENLADPWLGTESDRLIEEGIQNCDETLWLLYEADARDLIVQMLHEASLDPEQVQFAGELGLLLKHYDDFSRTAPWSMDRAMVYYPDSPNPIRMLTSNVLHANWPHVIFNMIFFLAFGMAIEVLIGNALLYLAIMLTISVASALAYSLYTFLFGDPLPSLGFSGVVVGMIGLSAYLMPQARIRTFIWIGFWAWIVYIPAWIFATWYIGGDILDLINGGMAGGTNLVAHVSGGLVGYYLGRRWLSERKWLIEVELQDEIEHMKATRGDWLGISSLRLNKRALRELKVEEEMRAHERRFAEMLRQVHHLNETHEYERALDLLLAGLKEYGVTEDVLRNVFDDVWKWTRTLFTLNFARYYITYLLAHHKQKIALKICETCFTFAPEFILAEPLDVMPLARLAHKQQRYPLVYSLVHNAEDRYGDSINTTDTRLLEAEMLAHHLDRPDDAQKVLESLKKDSPIDRKREIFVLEAAISPLLGQCH